MSKQGSNSSQRLLILTLNLLNTDLGYTKERLVQLVPGYLPADPDSAKRKLDRDFFTLREAGMIISSDGGLSPRFRIKTGTQKGDNATLTKDQFKLLVRAASAWNDQSSTQSAVILNKLRGLGTTESADPLEPTRIEFSGGPYLAAIHQAIVDAQPISFDYQSRSGFENREVAPWNLLVRGRALYLWGFDLNRWAPRLFRLSRFRSTPKLLAEPGVVASEGPLHRQQLQQDSFVVAPKLLVAKDRAPLIRIRTEPDILVDPGDIRVPDGWDLLQGTADDIGNWESALLRECDAVVVLSPPHLAELVKSKIETAAGWRESIDG